MLVVIKEFIGYKWACKNNIDFWPFKKKKEKSVGTNEGRYCL